MGSHLQDPTTKWTLLGTCDCKAIVGEAQDPVLRSWTVAGKRRQRVQLWVHSGMREAPGRCSETASSWKVKGVCWRASWMRRHWYLALNTEEVYVDRDEIVQGGGHPGGGVWEAAGGQALFPLRTNPRISSWATPSAQKTCPSHFL